MRQIDTMSSNKGAKRMETDNFEDVSASEQCDLSEESSPDNKKKRIRKESVGKAMSETHGDKKCHQQARWQ